MILLMRSLFRIKAGLVAFKGKVYIDTTGDGDLAAWSGASFKRGYDEEGSIQMSSLCFSFANIDSYDYINGPTLYVWKDESTPLYKAVPVRKISFGRYSFL